MKKNRRHELQTNVLADRLGGLITRFRPYLKVTGVVILIAIVIVGVWAWRGHANNEKKAAIWKDFLAVSMQSPASLSDLLTRSAKLEELADEHEGTPESLWIRAAAGNASLDAGMRQLYDDQAEARLTLMRAKGIYDDLSPISRTTDEGLHQRVQYGFAQACEALGMLATNEDSHKAHLEQAVKIYKELAASKSVKGIQLLAEHRLRILEPISGKAWSADDKSVERADWASWLAQQDLSASLIEPQGTVPGGGPHGTLPPMAFPELEPEPEDDSSKGGDAEVPPAKGEADPAAEPAVKESETPKAEGAPKKEPSATSGEKKGPGEPPKAKPDTPQGKPGEAPGSAPSKE